MSTANHLKHNLHEGIIYSSLSIDICSTIFYIINKVNHPIFNPFMNLKIVRFIVILVISLTLLPGCGNNDKVMHGYVEARLHYLSSSNIGKVTKLYVTRGQSVKAGDLIFTLEEEPYKSSMKQSQYALQESLSNLQDISKGLRPSEIDQIVAQIDQEQARLKFARKTQERRKKLVESKSIDEQSLDQSIQDLDVALGSLAELRAKLETGKLPAREDQIFAAKARVEEAQANLTKSEWYISKNTIRAPENGIIYDNYYELGEEVPANSPVVSLLVARDIKALFFIPENKVSTIKYGQKINITCDGCAKTFVGTISYISPEAEFTPPVIYSNESKAKLVYRVEVALSPEDTLTLHAGQPIEITL